MLHSNRISLAALKASPSIKLELSHDLRRGWFERNRWITIEFVVVVVKGCLLPIRSLSHSLGGKFSGDSLFIFPGGSMN